MARQAQRYIAKKGEKAAATSSSSSSSGSESSSLGSLKEGAEDTICQQASKVRMIFENYPGALASTALGHMRKCLLQELGEEDLTGQIKPVALLYFKQNLARRAVGPAQREVHTISTVIDLLVRGRASSALDCLTQRFKSIEATMGGTHWSVSQKLEVLPSEVTSLTPSQELGAARKEVETETRTRYLSSFADGRRPNKGAGKGKGDTKDDRRNQDSGKKGPKGSQKGDKPRKDGTG